MGDTTEEGDIPKRATTLSLAGVDLERTGRSRSIASSTTSCGARSSAAAWRGRAVALAMHNVIATIVDMRRTYRKMFSDEYDVPSNCERRR